MNSLIFTVLSLSLSGSIFIALLFLSKPLYKERLSRTWQYYIWLIVVARLLIPFSLFEFNLVGDFFNEIRERNMSVSTVTEFVENEPNVLIPNVVNDNAVYDNVLNDVEINITNNPITIPHLPVAQIEYQPANEIEIPVYPTTHFPSNILEFLTSYLWLIWLTVAVILFVRKLTIYQSFANYIRAGRVELDNIEDLERFGKIVEQLNIKKMVGIYTNSLISSPLLIGFFKPYIVLPTTDINESDFSYTVKHELIHYKRGDMFYKWLVQITMCLHWFNPLVYLMGREINNACEFSCDEAVIKNLDSSGIKAYGNTLLNALGFGGEYKNALSSVTLSENKKILGERLNMIKNFQNKSKFSIVVMVVLTMLLGVGAVGVYGITNPQSVSLENVIITPNENNVEINTPPFGEDFTTTTPPPLENSVFIPNENLIDDTFIFGVDFMFSIQDTIESGTSVLLGTMAIEYGVTYNFDIRVGINIGGAYIGLSPYSFGEQFTTNEVEVDWIYLTRTRNSVPFTGEENKFVYVYVIVPENTLLMDIWGNIYAVNLDNEDAQIIGDIDINNDIGFVIDDVDFINGLVRISSNIGHNELGKPSILGNDLTNIEEVYGLHMSLVGDDEIVFSLHNEEEQLNISQSGSFVAEANQVLVLNITSWITSSDVELLLIAPDGTEQYITIGQTMLTVRHIDLTEGEWAYNISGTFSSGNIRVTGVLSPASTFGQFGTAPPSPRPRPNPSPQPILSENSEFEFFSNAWFILPNNVAVEFPEWYTEDMWDVRLAWVWANSGVTTANMLIDYYSLCSNRRFIWGVADTQLGQGHDSGFEIRIGLPDGEIIVINLLELSRYLRENGRIADPQEVFPGSPSPLQITNPQPTTGITQSQARLIAHNFMSDSGWDGNSHSEGIRSIDGRIFYPFLYYLSEPHDIVYFIVVDSITAEIVHFEMRQLENPFDSFRNIYVAWESFVRYVTE